MFLSMKHDTSFFEANGPVGDCAFKNFRLFNLIASWLALVKVF